MRTNIQQDLLKNNLVNICKDLATDRAGFVNGRGEYPVLFLIMQVKQATDQN